MAIFKNQAAVLALSQEQASLLKTAISDRATLDQQLLKNLRQYRSKYDPEIEAILNSKEHQTRSKVYPRDTHVKVNGFVAKLMEMMFPAAEKNWGIGITPFPNIPEQDLALIIQGLNQQRMQAAQPPAATPAPITSDEIEAAVRALAEERATNMEKEIEDQLSDIGGERIEYPQLVKKILRSAGIYGFGVLEGPLVRTQEERVFEPQADGSYVPIKRKKLRPYLEQVKVWDIFPDLAAKSWRGQERIFRRRVFLKNGLLELADRPDFDKEAIKKFIKDHPDGNYVAMNYESELDTINNTSNTTKTRKGRFEVFRALGYVGAQKLVDIGVEVPEDKRDRDVLADIWLLGGEIIKADLAPFGDNPADSYFIFIYEDDEESGLTGIGLPEVLRDSQMRLCAIDRATMDNMAAVAGPIVETNRALLGRGKDVGPLHSFMNIDRDDDNPQTAVIPAVREITVNTHISEYIALREVVKQILDFESSLPSILFGQTDGLGEAFRTSNNMSMMTGAANMVTKDVVRSFDRFTTSVIGSLIAWNMEFNDKPEIKGDFQAQAKGSLSLVAKEIRGAALDQLWQTMDPEDRAITKRHKILTERFKSRDLPADYIEDEATARQILDNMAQAQAQAAQTEQALTQAKTRKFTSGAGKDDAQAQEILATLQSKIAHVQADIEQKLSTAKGVKDRGNLEHVKLLLDSLAPAGGRADSGGGKSAGQPSGEAA